MAIAMITMIPTPEVHAHTNKKPAKTSWFREKYLQQTYDDYYEYTVNRYSLEDNDIDRCPDFEKSASIHECYNNGCCSFCTRICLLYIRNWNVYSIRNTFML